MALDQEPDKQLALAFRDLRDLKVDVAFPFLLELYHDYVEGPLDKDDLAGAVRLVEAYVFRRAVCGIPTNSLNKTFATFGRFVRKDRYLESIEAHLLTIRSYRRFPDDEEFKRELKIRDLYQAVTGQVDVRTGQPYRAYKDSDVEWLGQVPEHWDVVRNGRLFVQRNEVGFAELPILEISLRTGIRVRDLEDPDRKQVISDRNKYKRAVEGDIAYNMMRMWQGAVGVTPVDGLVSPPYVVAKPLVGTNPQYFNALFRTSAYMTEIDKYSRGIVKDRNRLYWEDFKRMPTPRPPQEEQVLIADFNDSNVVTIDQEVCQLERQIHFLKEYRTRLVADVVTGKLDVRDAAAALPKVDPLAGDDVDDPVDTDMDSVLEELETVKEVAR